ncbi:Alpha N-terminal protein methyltransferase 1 [Orbilia brochopaga]|uniref:Alpha N-terminal protein methyltransferase 1 n=1 Tax=Orbilia brochopaga TaxID=3140254 RepID=A0AAV9USI6_9PEZI
MATDTTSPVQTSPSPAEPEPYNPLPPLAKRTQDYGAQIEYWSGIPSTVDGMLGGYPQLSRADLQQSSNFLAKLKPQMAAPADGIRRGVDCGAGIGRITKGLLAKHLDVIDIVEPVKKFTDELLLANPELHSAGRIGDIYNVGLESWHPTEGKYWLIWNQWCLNHLTDKDLISYLARCARALTPTGLIVVKENNTSTPSPPASDTEDTDTDTDITDNTHDIFDPEDCSVTRTDGKFRRIFAKAGLLVVKSELQRGFPERLKLYPVRMYALRPAPAKESK